MVARALLSIAVLLAAVSAEDTPVPATSEAPVTPPVPIGAMCEEQKNFDFVDNDFAQVQGPLSSCCDKCKLTTGCSAWSWNNWNNGTCFLKHNAGKTIVKEGVVSSRLLAVIPWDTCREQEHVDYEDANIGSAKALHAHDCCDICHNTLGCRFYAWNDYEGGTCWLKATGNKKVTKAHVYAAPAYATAWYNPPVTPTMPPGSDCEFQNGFDFVGHDLKQVQGPVETCCNACRTTDGCKAWSWNSWNGGTCFLKDGVGKIVENSGVLSGRIFPVVPLDGCRLEQDVDYEDANIASFQASKPEDCCKICQNHQGCRYYAWSNYQNGTCWLKATGDKKVTKKDVVSAPAYSTKVMI